jgi:hypothetical protein
MTNPDFVSFVPFVVKKRKTFDPQMDSMFTAKDAKGAKRKPNPVLTTKRRKVTKPKPSELGAVGSIRCLVFATFVPFAVNNPIRTLAGPRPHRPTIVAKFHAMETRSTPEPIPSIPSGSICSTGSANPLISSASTSPASTKSSNQSKFSHSCGIAVEKEHEN